MMMMGLIYKEKKINESLISIWVWMGGVVKRFY